MSSTSRISLERARAGDAPAIEALLRAAGLPHLDFQPHLAHFLVAREGDRVVGAVGAELAGGDALLRSLVVADDHRGQGLGGRLVDELETVAEEWNVERWWLLTTTAQAFFAARGFAVASRCAAPEGIQRTGQFSGGCGGSAVCMTRERRAAAPQSGTVDFDTAVAGFSEKLRAFIRRRVRDDATADDLTQETLLKVFRSREGLRDGQRLEAWVYRIARTTIIDHFRRGRTTEELPEAVASEPPDEVAKLREAISHSTRVFLETLPEAYREPVRLAEFEGMPLAKIALRLGISLTAVKSRVQRGRAMLKKKLQECCRFEFDRKGKIIGYERRKPCGC